MLIPILLTSNSQVPCVAPFGILLHTALYDFTHFPVGKLFASVIVVAGLLYSHKPPSYYDCICTIVILVADVNTAVDEFGCSIVNP